MPTKGDFMDNKYLRNNFNIKKINNKKNKITFQNSGILEKDFYDYANNFLYAGNLITRDLVSCKNIKKLDTWYFALVYIYRQSLELILKANIFILEQNSDNRKEIIGKVRHNLKEAFDEVVALSNTDISSNDNLIWLSKYLEDISNIDRSSDMFRYPFGNDLSIVFKKQTNVDLVANYYNFNRAFDILEKFYCNKQFSKKEYDSKICYEPKLIIEGGLYYGRSVVGYKYNERAYYPYYTAYEECGKFLATYMINNSDDRLFMPMNYMFRNSLELGLKRLIVEDSHFDYKMKLEILSKMKHSLLRLWNKVCEELKNYQQFNSSSIINLASKYIEKFHDFDGASDKFRYPCDKHLQSYFLSKTEFDIQNFSDCFIELCDFLDGLDMVLTDIKDVEQDSIGYSQQKTLVKKC